MRAEARFRACATDDGATRFTSLRSAPPLSLRSTPDALFIVGSGAGPVGGDELALIGDVERGAAVVLRSAAASMVLPGPMGEPSSMTVRATVHGCLMWKPEPTVIVAGCDHRSSVHVTVAVGGELRWREEVVLGRHGEAAGSLLQRVHVDVAGRPLLRTELPIGPRWPGSDGPAGLDGGRAVGSLLVVGGPAPTLSTVADDIQGVRAAVVALADHAWLVTAIAPNAASLRRTLDRAEGSRRADARQAPSCSGSTRVLRAH